MEKIKIEDLYCGEKYHIKNAVYEKAKRAQIDSCADGGRAWFEQEFIRQTLITINKIQKNGDCISDEELGDAVTVSVSEPTPIDIKDEDFGAILICAVRYCLGRHTYMPGLIIGYITPLLPHISDNTLRCMETDLCQPDLYGGFGEARINEPIWIKFRCDIQEEIQRRKEKSDENT